MRASGIDRYEGTEAMTDQERAHMIRVINADLVALQGKVAGLQAQLKFLNAGCNSYFSPDGIESVKCNIDHLCSECEPAPSAPIDGD